MLGAGQAGHPPSPPRAVCPDVIPLRRDVGTAGEARTPPCEFFDACFQRLGNPPREEVLLIGDSLTADIQGAAAYGLPCCWFDHDGTGAPAPAGADHVARKLTDILQWY